MLHSVLSRYSWCFSGCFFSLCSLKSLEVNWFAVCLLLVWLERVVATLPLQPSFPPPPPGPLKLLLYFNWRPNNVDLNRCSLLQHLRVSDLHNVFNYGLVGTDLGELQPANVLANPGDEGELGSFAHGVPCSDPDEGEQTSVIWGRRWNKLCKKPPQAFWIFQSDLWQANKLK